MIENIRDIPVVVFGATGAVGRAFLAILSQFGARRVAAVASHNAGGTRQVTFGEGVLPILTPEQIDFSAFRFCLMSSGEATSRAWAPRIAQAGCTVIDNSSAWRMDPTVPLVVPEVNPHSLKKQARLIANPNCVVIPLCAVLAPIHKKMGIERVVVSTYQSTSGAGQDAMNELIDQSKALFTQAQVERTVFPKRIAFNILPQVGAFQEDGRSEEEEKIESELHKILDPLIRVSVTCVRVPTLIGHAMTVNIACKKAATPAAVVKLFERSDAIWVVNRLEDGGYITPIEAAYTDPIYVSRIRRDASVPHGLNLWIVTDNLRKGAALNAIQIMAQALG